MGIVMIDTEAFGLIMKKLDAIEQKLAKKTASPEEVWMDSEQLCSYLRISSRTLQNYRDRGEISFSQHGAKIWYRKKDVQEFLLRNKKAVS